MKKTYLIINLLIVFGLYISCSNPEKKFREAKEINTIESYQQYVQKFPTSTFADSAKAKIDSIAYINASKENTEESYYKYAKTYPKSKFAEESLNKAASIAYEIVIKDDIESKYLDFAKKYSKSEYEQAALNRAAVLRFEKASKEYTEEELERFVSDYPKSELVNEAKILIDNIKNGRRYLSKKEFIEKLKNVNEKDFAKLWKYKLKVIDGGNEFSFKPDKRNGSIPIIDLETPGIGPVNISHLVIILNQEGMVPMGGKGIGEIFFWHRSILVYFMDESVPKALQNQVYEQHVIKSKKQRVNLKKYPFSILCTRVQN